jgi:D-amino peptidase
MRVFISADIEGVTGTTAWDETEIGCHGYEAACRQMTAEVKAACEGAIAAGADYILVKDAHDSGRNIDITQLPECVEVIRGWSGHPFSMAYGVDDSFDAAMFVGYHSPAGTNGNPLSHTFTTKTTHITLNGEPCSEFMLYSWAAASVGVPTVLLSGDKALCELSSEMHPLLKTIAVKDGLGGCTRSINPGLACQRIKDAAEAALKQDLSKGDIQLPEEFELMITYKEHPAAVLRSSFPGCELVGDRTVHFVTRDFFEVLRAVCFIF